MPPRTYCIVYGCFRSRLKSKELTFFRLPKDSERCAKWLQLICREDLMNKSSGNLQVCETHFNPDDLIVAKTRKILKPKTLPSRHLPIIRKQREVIALEKCTQTETYTLTRPKRKLKDRNLLTLRKALKLHESDDEDEGICQITSFHKLCDRFLTKDMAELVKAQTHWITSYTENRCNKSYQDFCFRLFFTSPQAYRLLRGAVGAPSPNTLIKHIPATAKMDVISTLKCKVEAMTDMEKNCSIVLGVMSVKPNLFYDIKEDKIIGFQDIDGVQSTELAKNALVVMARGIFSNWTQPVGFALISDSANCDEIDKWIEKLLEKLFEIGLNIRTFVSDLNSDLFEAAKRSTVEKPYFFINNRKIYHLFDAPNLIKMVRDNLIVYDFHFEGQVAKYEHIVQFYEIDKQVSCKLAQKLTDSHVHPSDLERNEVKYAVELLSSSVAAGISAYVDFQVIEESGRDTATFIKTINDLFDALNSSNVKDNDEFKRAYRGEERQELFFNKMLLFFQNLKLIDPNTGKDVTPALFIEGFQITIKSILMLFEDLKSEECTCLLTKRLNRDALGNFLEEIRTKCTTQPTSRRFLAAFKKLSYSNVTKSLKSDICADDLGKLIIQASKLGQLNDEASFKEETISDTNNPEDVQIKSSEYNKLNLPEEVSPSYISKFLLKKCAQHHSDCQVQKSSTSTTLNETINNSESLIEVEPFDDFVEYIMKIDEVFCVSFQRYQTDCNIAALIYKEIDKIDFLAPCPCFPVTYLKKLFIRMKIFNTIKFHNRELQTHTENEKNIVILNSIKQH